MTDDIVQRAPNPKWTERDMLDLLRAKYTSLRLGTTADRYVRAEHARLPSDRYGGGALRIADYLVLDTYQPQQMLGFEVKVSRSDWLAELRDPTKAEAWKRYCHRWYLVVPDAEIVRDDLPADWGLMTPSAAGLRIRRRASPLTPDLMPWSVLASLGRSIAQTTAKEANNAYGPALRDDAPQLVADLAAEVEYASSERVLASTIDRVRMLHSKRPVAPGCTNCSEPWPCSTIRALEVTQ